MSNVKLTPKWCLDAAMLSRPVDLTNLVTMSRNNPEQFVHDQVLHRLITILLNEKNSNKSNKDTKLDVLNILSNVATANKECLEEVRSALGGISEWFDEYMATEENDATKEPELHKTMVLLLGRCWEYQLKTEDVLELTQGNRRIALCTIVGLLEDGETYTTELKQRQKPSLGKMGQWQHELVINRYEKPLLLQICRLLRGFTHPGTYFDSNTRNDGGEIELFNVERFSEEIDMLLEITMRSRFVEKLSVALYDCFLLDDLALKEDPDRSKNGILDESDHLAVACVHAFLQNLYFYATNNVEEFRLHMLMDTLLIPRLIVPYLDKCVTHALILNSRAEFYTDLLEGDQVAQLILHNPQLVQGITSTLRTLIIASFRAPNTLYVMVLLRKLNPTVLLLRAVAFCKHHAYVFTLLCMLNVNMGTLDLSRKSDNPPPPSELSIAMCKSPTAAYFSREETRSEENQNAMNLVRDLERIYSQMSKEAQQSVLKRVMSSGALPIARDTPSYVTIMSLLLGGVAGQLDYRNSHGTPKSFAISPRVSTNSTPADKYRFLTSDTSQGSVRAAADAKGGPTVDLAQDFEEEEDISSIRAEAKRDYLSRLSLVTNASNIDVTVAEDVSDSNVYMEAKTVVAEADAITKLSLQETDQNQALQEDPSKEAHKAFNIAVAVAEAQDSKAKSSKPSSPIRKREAIPSIDTTISNPNEANDSKYRLLGELPSLLTKSGQDRANDIKMAMQLELPLEMNKKHQLLKSFSGISPRNNDAKQAKSEEGSRKKDLLPSVQPMEVTIPKVTPQGIYFEKETIELWLTTRGSICPITLQPLTIGDLKPADDVRNRIKRYQIEQTALRTQIQGENDLYDF